MGNHAGQIILNADCQHGNKPVALGRERQVARIEPVGDFHAALRMAGEGGLPAEGDAQAAGLEPDFAVFGKKRDLRPVGKPESGVSFHGIAAVHGAFQPGNIAEGAQLHPDQPVVRAEGILRQRGGEQHQKSQKNCRKSHDSLLFGRSPGNFCHDCGRMEAVYSGN